MNVEFRVYMCLGFRFYGYTCFSELCDELKIGENEIDEEENIQKKLIMQQK